VFDRLESFPLRGLMKREPELYSLSAITRTILAPHATSISRGSSTRLFGLVFFFMDYSLELQMSKSKPGPQEAQIYKKADAEISRCLPFKHVIERKANGRLRCHTVGK
jgi:hypothetical protein